MTVEQDTPATTADSPGAPAIRHPVPGQEPSLGGEHSEEAPLPALDESDSVIQDALIRMIASAQLQKLVVVQNFIRRAVITIDNLPRATIPRKDIPLTAVTGRFVVNETGSLAIGADNYQRYNAYVELVESVNTDKLLSLYLHLYPLFQQAYQDLGYPAGYFNDRLIDVIDHLLATPEIAGPILLVQPHVLYQYANPQIEGLSAGQKLLIRMGLDNARRVKTELLKFRNGLLART